ncbi:MAG: hypothetical protein J6X18_00695 [Bacteroidales bacterium]|nr:hypothetical protein [Bacteroidales bacterium]
MKKLKQVPKTAEYQETRPNGTKVYVSKRTAYFVYPDGEITSTHINR